MELVYTVDWMKQAARQAHDQGRVVGLVPAAGALHDGQLSLVRAARVACSPVIVSVFADPKRFGSIGDYARHPSALDSDRAKLEALGVEYLFAPPTEEIYPLGFATSVTVDGLGERFEGRSHTGHFRSVATLVLKLLEIVRPALAYFGRKDVQQARLVSRMARDLNLDAEIVVCPIVREPDGLACSSLNAHLQGEERRAGAALYQALAAVRERIERGERSATPLIDEMRRVLAREPLAAVDYAAIVDADSFEPAARLRGSCLAVLAVFIGSMRLIDNLLIEERPGGGFSCDL